MSARKGVCNAALDAYQAGKGRAKRPIQGIYGPYSTGWKSHEKKRAAGRILRLAGKTMLFGVGVVAPVVAWVMMNV